MVSERGPDESESEFGDEDARAAALAQRRLLINSWKARDDLYKQLFGNPSYVTPEHYGRLKQR